MADSKSDGLFGGLIIGAALGAIAGILAAPRPGKDTRRILRKSADALPELAEDLATSIQFHADRLSDTTLSNWDQTLGRLREAVAAGQAASRREWEQQTYSDTDYTAGEYSNGDHSSGDRSDGDYSDGDSSDGDSATLLTEDE